MRIAIDATCWANGRGYGRYTRQVVPELALLAPDDEFICLLDARSAEVFNLHAPNVHRVLVPLSMSPTEAAAADNSRSPADMLRLTRALWQLHPDVFFSPSVYTYFPLPPFLRAVVTVHDAITERFPELTLPTPRARLFWKMKVGLALRQARLILTVSDFARQEISEMLQVAPSRLRVALEAPAAAFRPVADQAEIRAAARRRGLPDGASWFIYVGGFNPHKNVDVLVRAHADAARAARGTPPHLLLVGATSGDPFHGNHGVIRRAVEEMGTTGLVHWTGFVPDEELRFLHAGALALVLPSANEGFGLPAVEAAACGTPVIATLASPLPQILEGAGLFVEPGDETALAAAMRKMMDDPPARSRMAACAPERVAGLGWPRTARAVLDTLYEAAA